MNSLSAKKLSKASQRILARHQAQDGLGEDEINHNLKQKEKLDNTKSIKLFPTQRELKGLETRH